MVRMESVDRRPIPGGFEHPRPHPVRASQAVNNPSSRPRFFASGRLVHDRVLLLTAFGKGILVKLLCIRVLALAVSTAGLLICSSTTQAASFTYDISGKPPATIEWE